VLEAKVVREGAREHLHRERHQRPAAIARLQPLHVDVQKVIVGQVNVNDELTLRGLEDLKLLMVARRRREDGANVNLER